jgi:hypothetical protein
VRAAGERVQALERVPERVSVVQDQAPARVTLVERDEVGLRAHAARHDPFQGFRVAPQER